MTDKKLDELYKSLRALSSEIDIKAVNFPSIKVVKPTGSYGVLNNDISGMYPSMMSTVQMAGRALRAQDDPTYLNDGTEKSYVEIIYSTIQRSVPDARVVTVFDECELRVTLIDNFTNVEVAQEKLRHAFTLLYEAGRIPELEISDGVICGDGYFFHVSSVGSHYPLWSAYEFADKAAFVMKETMTDQPTGASSLIYSRSVGVWIRSEVLCCGPMVELLEYRHQHLYHGVFNRPKSGVTGATGPTFNGLRSIDGSTSNMITRKLSDSEFAYLKTKLEPYGTVSMIK